MTPLPGLPHTPQHVCRLRPAIYGLKQAPMTWFECFWSIVRAIGSSLANPPPPTHTQWYCYFAPIY